MAALLRILRAWTGTIGGYHPPPTIGYRQTHRGCQRLSRVQYYVQHCRRQAMLWTIQARMNLADTAGADCARATTLEKDRAS
jgi:hypothetical protein